MGGQVNPGRRKQAETGGTINFRMISCVAIMGIWALALLLFIIFWLRGSLIWLIFWARCRCR